VDCEPRHGNAKDEKENLIHVTGPSDDLTPERFQGHDQSPIPGDVSCDASYSPFHLFLGLLGLNPLIPYSHDSSEHSMGDMGSCVAFLLSAGAQGSRAPGRTGHRPQKGSRPDVPVPVEFFPVLLNGEFHAANFPRLVGSLPYSGPASESTTLGRAKGG